MQLDHIVHIVPDREGAAASLRREGLHVITGGEHPHWGTHNALAYFPDLSYIELIAINDRKVAAGSDFGAPILRFLEQGAGVGTVALRTGDMAGDLARLRTRGIAMGDAKEGSRRLPDGTLLTWRLALAPWPLPFLIEWGAPPEARLADLSARGALNPAPMRVERVLWAVAELQEGLRWLAGAYGAAPGDRYQEHGATCVDSSVGITLCAPTGPGPVRDRLERRGEGPVGYAIANGPVILRF